MGRTSAGTLSGVSVGLSQSWGREWEVWRWRQHRQPFTECDRERERRLCSLEGDSGSEEGIILRWGRLECDNRWRFLGLGPSLGLMGNTKCVGPYVRGLGGQAARV